MTNESKKLAKNSLDDENDLPPVVGTIAIFVAAIVIMAVLGLLTGSFKVSITDGVTVDEKVWNPPTPVASKNNGLVETIVTGLTTTIETTQEDTLRTLLVDEKIRFADWDTLSKSEKRVCAVGPFETVESVIKEYGSCKWISNMELEGDDYEDFVDLLEHYPDLRVEAASRVKRFGKLMYIDMRELKQIIDDIQAAKSKQELLKRAADAKTKLLN